MTTLRDLLLDSRDGEWGKGEHFENSVEMAVIRGTDFDAVRVGSLERVPVRHLATRHAARKALRNWDIIIETAGGSKDRPTGRTLLLTPSRTAGFGMPVTCASFARFLRIDPQTSDPAFVFWKLQDLYNRRTLFQFHTQHTGVARFQFTVFANTLPLQLPSLSVQKRVADILCAYDDLIENNTRRIAVLEQMTSRLFEEWVVAPIGKLPMPSDRLDEWELPDGWTFKRLVQVANIIMGQSPPSTLYNDEGDGLPFHQGVTEFTRYYHRTRLYCRDPGKFRQAREGDILFSVRAPVGRIATALGAMVLGRGLSSIRSTADAQAYLLLHLRHQFSATDLFGSGTIYKAITKDDLHNVPIVVPDAGLLHRLEEIGANNWAMIKSLHLANSTLKASRDLLLPKLVSGEVSVAAVEADLELAAQ